jgi:hypothetical protein
VQRQSLERYEQIAQERIEAEPSGVRPDLSAGEQGGRQLLLEHMMRALHGAGAVWPAEVRSAVRPISQFLCGGIGTRVFFFCTNPSLGVYCRKFQPCLAGKQAGIADAEETTSAGTHHWHLWLRRKSPR